MTVPTTPPPDAVLRAGQPPLPLPGQPTDAPWPTETWAEADPADLGADDRALGALLDRLVSGSPDPDLGLTHAAAVVAGGKLVAERYGVRPVQDLRALEPDPPHDAVTADTRLLSWSMAKSLTHLAVGVAVGDGAFALTDRVPEPQWADRADRRHDLTWDDLLAMRPGLAWTEEYYDVEAGMPDVFTMLFGEGADDMAGYAASRPLVSDPGATESYVYSSGTTNIVAANLARALGLDRAGMESFVRERILDPIGMTSAELTFDAAGTFLGSSYAYATLRDWCRFGLLALRGGTWDGTPIVPDGWIDHGRTPRTWDEDMWHGSHWWAWDQAQMPFGAHGFEGQRIICFPTRDVVVVRTGRSDPEQKVAVNALISRIADCFPARS